MSRAALFLLLAFTTLLVGAALGEDWCGKPLSAVELPSLAVTPGRSIYTHENEGALLFTLRGQASKHALDGAAHDDGHDERFSFIVERDDATATPLPMLASFAAVRGRASNARTQRPGAVLWRRFSDELTVWRASFPLDLLGERTLTAPYKLRVRVACDACASDVTASVPLSLWRLPPRGSLAVKVDHENEGALLRDTADGTGSAGLQLSGAYLSWGQWLGYNVSFLDELMTNNFNVINPVAPMVTNNNYTQLWPWWKRANELQINWQYDINESDMTQMAEQIALFKDQPALLGWYIGNEPDGPGDNATALAEVRRTINEQLDPYHPVFVVLNCQNTALAYSVTADVLMTDPYPIGINLSLCTPTTGDCGCDDCFTATATDVNPRLDAYNYQLQGLNVPVWLVPQAFGNCSYWSRAPNPQEVVYMDMSGLTHGAVAMLRWMVPFSGSCAQPNAHTSIHIPMFDALFELAGSLRHASLIPPPGVRANVTTSLATVKASAWVSPLSNASLVIFSSNLALSSAYYSVSLPDSALALADAGEAFAVVRERMRAIRWGYAIPYPWGSGPTLRISEGRFVDALLPPLTVHVWFIRATSA